MTTLPKGWNPRDTAHAVECLQFWIDCTDGRRNLRDFIRELGKEHFAPTSMKGLFESLSIVEGFVDGAKSVLEMWRYAQPDKTWSHDYNKGFHEGSRNAMDTIVIVLAKRYAPRMAEAGFEVPK